MTRPGLVGKIHYRLVAVRFFCQHPLLLRLQRSINCRDKGLEPEGFPEQASTRSYAQGASDFWATGGGTNNQRESLGIRVGLQVAYYLHSINIRKREIDDEHFYRWRECHRRHL